MFLKVRKFDKVMFIAYKELQSEMTEEERNEKVIALKQDG